MLNYISNPEVFTYQNGMCNLLTKPGLGVDVNEEYVRKMAEVGKGNIDLRLQNVLPYDIRFALQAVGGVLTVRVYRAS